MGLWIDDDPDYDYQLVRTPKRGGESQYINFNKQVLSLLQIREHEWKSATPATVVKITPKTKKIKGK